MTASLPRIIMGALALVASVTAATAAGFNGLDCNLGNLYRISPAQSRSISPENFTGEKGAGGMATNGTGKHAASELGRGWKVSPSVKIKSGETFTLAEIKGSGCIQQIWMTPTGNWRNSIIRFYWDDETTPSVECPVGDFFACGWGKYAQINSLAVCVNPGSAFNCYWQMPFHKRARITLENRDAKDMTLYYQVNYTLTEVPADAGLFHAQFRRESPLKSKGTYTILDGVQGRGQYVGPIWPGKCIVPAGGARARSSFSSMATASGRRSAAPARRIIFVAATILKSANPGLRLLPTANGWL